MQKGIHFFQPDWLVLTWRQLPVKTRVLAGPSKCSLSLRVCHCKTRVFWRPPGKAAGAAGLGRGTTVFEGISREVPSCLAVGMPEQGGSGGNRRPTFRTGIMMSEAIDDDANRWINHGVQVNEVRVRVDKVMKRHVFAICAAAAVLAIFAMSTRLRGQSPPAAP